jgi:hypothetical protein
VFGVCASGVTAEAAGCMVMELGAGWGWEVMADASGMRSATFGGKMGSSGCRIVACRRSETSCGCVRVDKYARFYVRVSAFSQD